MCRAHRRNSSFSSDSRSSSDVSSSWFTAFSEQCRITGTTTGDAAGQSSEAADKLFATADGTVANWLEQNGMSTRSLRRREREWMQLAASQQQPGDPTGLFPEAKPKLYVEARRLR